MTDDYSAHLIALDALHRDISQLLRDKRYSEADQLCAKAMSQLARLHVCIKRYSAPIA